MGGVFGFAAFILIIVLVLVVGTKVSKRRDAQPDGKKKGINPRVTQANSQPMYPNTVFGKSFTFKK